MEYARSVADVLAELEEIAAHDGSWGYGRAFTYVFDGPNLEPVTGAAMRLFAASNGLDPTAFKIIGASDGAIHFALPRFVRRSHSA